MPTGRGPFAALHPKFAADSPAACPEIDVADFVAYKEGDVVVDLVYSAADDEAIKQWLRENVSPTCFIVRGRD
jgi:alcohol oxidase